jgi:excisionase family DNA binding protein
MQPTIHLLPPQRVANSEQVAPLQYSLKDAARLLSMSRRTIERLIARRELATVGRGKLRRIPIGELLAWQERNRSEGF